MRGLRKYQWGLCKSLGSPEVRKAGGDGVFVVDCLSNDNQRKTGEKLTIR